MIVLFCITTILNGIFGYTIVLGLQLIVVLRF